MQRLGAGNGIGHLLECGAQVTGGYFSDPGFKDVPEPWNFGFPIAEVRSRRQRRHHQGRRHRRRGDAADRASEQMLYEVHDPANYLTPDVVVDFTTATLEQVGPDRVRVAQHRRQAAHADPQGLDRLHRRLHRRGHVLLRRARARLRRAQAGQAHPRGALQDRGAASRGDPHRLPRPERHPRRRDAGRRARALRGGGAGRRPHRGPARRR